MPLPSTLVPSARPNAVTKPPESRVPFVRAGPDQRPAFAARQRDDAVDVFSRDPVRRTGIAMHDLATPPAAIRRVEHLFRIATIDYRGFERPRVIMWVSVGFLPAKAMERSAVRQMIFCKCRRHSLDANNRSADWYARDRRTGDARRCHLPLCQSLSASLIVWNVSPSAFCALRYA
jgi:hypothetical protein